VRLRVLYAVISALLLIPSAVNAQSFGVGGRFAFITTDPDDDDSAVDRESRTDRYFGGLFRARMSDRASLEVSFDYRTDSEDVLPALQERIKAYPLQLSLLAYLARGRFAPYLVGGIGWYSQKVDLLLDNELINSTTTHPFGYHAGFGAEISLGRRVGIHADYRYRFVNEDDDGDDGGIPIVGFLTGLSRNGSMWTTGLTVYF
jgi:opacity protein-like surface antigen